MEARMSHRPYVTDPQEAKELAERFAKVIHKELGHLVKSVVWFGSFKRATFTSGKRPILSEEIMFSSDIDVMIIFDDLIHVINPEVITAYRVITEKVASGISKRLHITTMPITKFWDYCLKGDPILINMLRDGETLYDTGTFGMAKQMLGSKLVHPSREIIWIYLANGPVSLQTAKWNVKQAVMDLYWCVMDAAHTALLTKDVVPDSPDHVVDLFDQNMVRTRLMEKKHLSTLAEFHNVGKMLMKGELDKVSGDQYDRYRREAEEFLKGVKEMLNKG
ncbi:TPA: nucleotidyltransferase domain-containing protein [Candidatus Woesearchaeota archaeon]|nr:nucleotidyltransferase domain-containing protein [Candidatus Woesearchaeota archaeon]